MSDKEQAQVKELSVIDSHIGKIEVRGHQVWMCYEEIPNGLHWRSVLDLTNLVGTIRHERDTLAKLRAQYAARLAELEAELAQLATTECEGEI